MPKHKKVPCTPSPASGMLMFHDYSTVLKSNKYVSIRDCSHRQTVFKWHQLSLWSWFWSRVLHCSVPQLARCLTAVPPPGFAWGFSHDRNKQALSLSSGYLLKVESERHLVKLWGVSAYFLWNRSTVERHKNKSETWRFDQQGTCCKCVISSPKHDFKTWIQLQGAHAKRGVSEWTDHVKPEHNSWPGDVLMTN